MLLIFAIYIHFSCEVRSVLTCVPTPQSLQIEYCIQRVAMAILRLLIGLGRQSYSGQASNRFLEYILNFGSILAKLFYLICLIYRRALSPMIPYQRLDLPRPRPRKTQRRAINFVSLWERRRSEQHYSSSLPKFSPTDALDRRPDFEPFSLNALLGRRSMCYRKAVLAPQCARVGP